MSFPDGALPLKTLVLSAILISFKCCWDFKACDFKYNLIQNDSKILRYSQVPYY